MSLFDQLSDNIRDKRVRIAYAEGHDRRVLGAAVRLKVDDLVDPVLVGDPEKIAALAKENRWSLDGIEIFDPRSYPEFDEMVEAFLDRRKGKHTEEEARKLLVDNAYFATMLVYMGKADGFVCGADYPTGDTVRPALQIIKTKPGVKLTSGAFLMVSPEENGQRLLFADCAININPDAEALAAIAVESAKTAKMFGIEPNVAMLSFSTKGSAASPEVDKVVQATALAKEMDPDLNIDGELQFDAAYAAAVGKQKAPGSPVAGKANVFVFPEIHSGNIGYKIAQRLGGYQAVGPILQGLNKPISDLSRGCVEEDVYKVSIITANQALQAD